MNAYRIQDKDNVHVAGRQRTTFKVFERQGDAYLYRGNFTAPGHNASDKKCIDTYEANENGQQD